MTTFSDKKFKKRLQGIDNLFYWQVVGAATTNVLGYFEKRENLSLSTP
jgi:hypothetical protein